MFCFLNNKPILQNFYVYMNIIPFFSKNLHNIIFFSKMFYHVFSTKINPRGASIHRINDLFPLKPPLAHRRTFFTITFYSCNNGFIQERNTPMHISANESPHLTAAVKQQKMASFHLSTDYSLSVIYLFFQHLQTCAK